MVCRSDLIGELRVQLNIKEQLQNMPVPMILQLMLNDSSKPYVTIDLMNLAGKLTIIRTSSGYTLRHVRDISFELNISASSRLCSSDMMDDTIEKFIVDDLIIALTSVNAKKITNIDMLRAIVRCIDKDAYVALSTERVVYLKINKMFINVNVVLGVIELEGLSRNVAVRNLDTDYMTILISTVVHDWRVSNEPPIVTYEIILDYHEQ